MNTIENIKPKKRIVLIDALRGYALMGLFIVHMIEYYEVYWYMPVPNIYKDITFLLFGGKAYAIFALLFGLSFFIIMDSQKKQGVDFRWRFSWRLTILLFAGFLHGIIYGGDILQILALAGFLLIPIYNARNYLLIVFALFFLLQISAIVNFIQINNMSEQPLHWSLMGYVHSIYANGSFLDVIKVNLLKGSTAKWTFMIESGRLSTIMGISILGFWLGKIGFFEENSSHKNRYKMYFFTSVLIGIILLFIKPYIGTLIKSDEYWMTNAILNSYIDLVFTFVTIFTFVFLFQFKVLQKILGLLAPCGRMSLTIYVTQSIIFIPFFYGFGFGAFSYIGQPLSFSLGIALWITQVWLAQYWFKNYYYGPLEWLWRSATYLRKDISFKRT